MDKGSEHTLDLEVLRRTSTWPELPSTESWNAARTEKRLAFILRLLDRAFRDAGRENPEPLLSAASFYVNDLRPQLTADKTPTKSLAEALRAALSKFRYRLNLTRN